MLSKEELNIEEYFKEKVVVITGGTSGLGKAMAEKLHDLGAKVAIIGRRKPLLDEMKESRDFLAIQADVADKEMIYKISGIVQGYYGEIDILINNASYLGSTPLRLLLDTECEDLEDVLQTNLLAPFRLTKAFLPGMILRKQGIVLNISSDAAVSSYATWGPYSVSKAALDHLSAIWNAELQASGINFYSLDPGDMYTPMHLDAIPDANKDDLLDPAEVAWDMLQFLAGGKDTGRYSAMEWREVL